MSGSYLRRVDALLPEGQLSALNANLTVLLGTLQEANGLKSFGQCRSCCFNLQRVGGYFCALTQETLSKRDIELICREHEFPGDRETHV